MGPITRDDASPSMRPSRAKSVPAGVAEVAEAMAAEEEAVVDTAEEEAAEAAAGTAEEEAEEAAAEAGTATVIEFLPR